MIYKLLLDCTHTIDVDKSYWILFDNNTFVNVYDWFQFKKTYD
jgi:hypothetical protein